MAHIDLTKDNFDAEALGGTPALVDFWAEWCGPCKMMAPIFEALSGEYVGKVKFCKLNVDDEGELAIKYNVSGIPTVVLFKDGAEADRLVGLRPSDEVADFIDKNL